MHAEDQMASTEMAKVMAREFIELYRDEGKQIRYLRIGNTQAGSGNDRLGILTFNPSYPSVLCIFSIDFQRNSQHQVMDVQGVLRQTVFPL